MLNVAGATVPGSANGLDRNQVEHALGQFVVWATAQLTWAAYGSKMLAGEVEGF